MVDRSAEHGTKRARQRMNANPLSTAQAANPVGHGSGSSTHDSSDFQAKRDRPPQWQTQAGSSIQNSHASGATIPRKMTQAYANNQPVQGSSSSNSQLWRGDSNAVSSRENPRSAGSAPISTSTAARNQTPRDRQVPMEATSHDMHEDLASAAVDRLLASGYAPPRGHAQNYMEDDHAMAMQMHLQEEIEFKREAIARDAAYAAQLHAEYNANRQNFVPPDQYPSHTTSRLPSSHVDPVYLDSNSEEQYADPSNHQSSSQAPYARTHPEPTRFRDRKKQRANRKLKKRHMVEHLPLATFPHKKNPSPDLAVVEDPSNSEPGPSVERRHVSNVQGDVQDGHEPHIQLILDDDTSPTPRFQIILDTNILIGYLDFLRRLLSLSKTATQLLVPKAVLCELDALKSRHHDIDIYVGDTVVKRDMAFVARDATNWLLLATREIDQVIVQRLDEESLELSESRNGDARILAYALKAAQRAVENGIKIALFSNDNILRLNAQCEGIFALSIKDVRDDPARLLSILAARTMCLRPTNPIKQSEPAGTTEPVLAVPKSHIDLEPSEELTEAPAKQPSQEPTKEPTKESAKELSKESAQEPSKEPPSEPPEKSTKPSEDSTKPSEDSTKPSEDSAKEPSKEPAKEPSKEPANDLKQSKPGPAIVPAIESFPKNQHDLEASKDPKQTVAIPKPTPAIVPAIESFTSVSYWPPGRQIARSNGKINPDQSISGPDREFRERNGLFNVQGKCQGCKFRGGKTLKTPPALAHHACETCLEVICRGCWKVTGCTWDCTAPFNGEGCGTTKCCDHGRAVMMYEILSQLDSCFMSNSFRLSLKTNPSSRPVVYQGDQALNKYLVAIKTLLPSGDQAPQTRSSHPSLPSMLLTSTLFEILCRLLTNDPLNQWHLRSQLYLNSLDLIQRICDGVEEARKLFDHRLIKSSTCGLRSVLEEKGCIVWRKTKGKSSEASTIESSKYLTPKTLQLILNSNQTLPETDLNEIRNKPINMTLYEVLKELFILATEKMEEYHVRIGLVISKSHGNDENEVDSDEIEMMMMIDRILDLATSFVQIFKNVGRLEVEDGHSPEEQAVTIDMTGRVKNPSVPKASVSREQAGKNIQRKNRTIKSALDKKTR